MVKIIILLFCLLTSTNVFADNLKDVFKTFKKLENQISVGISRNEYKNMIADAKTDLDMFLIDYQGNDKNMIAEIFKDIITSHELAEMTMDYTTRAANYGFLDMNTAPVKSFLQSYPEAEKPVVDGGIIFVSDKGQKSAYAKAMVSWYVNLASKKLKEFQQAFLYISTPSNPDNKRTVNLSEPTLKKNICDAAIDTVNTSGQDVKINGVGDGIVAKTSGLIVFKFDKPSKKAKNILSKGAEKMVQQNNSYYYFFKEGTVKFSGL